MTSGGDLETIIGQVASLLQGKDRQLFTLTSTHTQFWIANEPKMSLDCGEKPDYREVTQVG